MCTCLIIFVYILKQIISPIRTLREKEHEKKTRGVQPEETRAEDSEESVGEDVTQSPSSSWGSENSISSQLVAVKWGISSAANVFWFVIWVLWIINLFFHFYTASL